MGIDYKNAKRVILYGRNIFESISVKEVRTLLQALDKGAKLTYIDPRVTKTAVKAHNYWMIRPGTDLALNYALIHVILKEGLYNKEFVDRWVLGLEELRDFVEPYTPEWAGGGDRHSGALHRESCQGGQQGHAQGGFSFRIPGRAS